MFGYANGVWMNEDDDDSDTQCISFEFVVNFKYHYGWSIFVYFLMGFCIKFHAHTWTSHDWMTETEWKYGNKRITNIFEKKPKTIATNCQWERIHIQHSTTHTSVERATAGYGDGDDTMSVYKTIHNTATTTLSFIYLTLIVVMLFVRNFKKETTTRFHISIHLLLKTWFGLLSSENAFLFAFPKSAH